MRALVSLLLLTPACVASDFAYLATEKFDPRPPNYKIEIVEEAARPHILVGKASASTGNLASQTDCIDALREQARKNGGDALVGLRMAIGDPGTVGENKKLCQADVVRWK